MIEPIKIGPTWRRNSDHPSGWDLPEFTLGWAIVAWQADRIQMGGKPWRYTPEQLRLTLWWFALTPDLRFVFRDGTVQRLKGWGKDPLAASWSLTELCGPSRPDMTGRTVLDPWGNEHPAGVVHADPWVQIAATSEYQTKTTMRLFPGMVTKQLKAEHALDLGKIVIYSNHGAGVIEGVTRSPVSLEGARSTFVIRNEGQHWLERNDGHEMADVIDRNVVKSADGQGRAVTFGNAPEPSEDSMLLREREAFEAIEAGKSAATGILYDSLEAPPDAPMTPEGIPQVIEGVRGDSHWLDIDRITATILDPKRSPQVSRRYWFNQIVAAEDAWADPKHIDLCAAPDMEHDPADGWVLFFDGSKSDDSTAMVGCRLSDGHVVTLGIWAKPQGARGVGWIVPRTEVDERVRHVLDVWDVKALWADPSHAKDDDSTSYWQAIIDGWHQDYGRSLVLWAVAGGPNKHSTMWDMASPKRVEAFTAAAEQAEADLRSSAEVMAAGDPEGRTVTHDNHPALVAHLKHCRRSPNRYGVSVWKGHRESARKIDLGVCFIGARMLRRQFLNTTATRKTGKQAGRAW